MSTWLVNGPVGPHTYCSGPLRFLVSKFRFRNRNPDPKHTIHMWSVADNFDTFCIYHMELGIDFLFRLINFHKVHQGILWEHNLEIDIFQVQYSIDIHSNLQKILKIIFLHKFNLFLESLYAIDFQERFRRVEATVGKFKLFRKRQGKNFSYTKIWLFWHSRMSSIGGRGRLEVCEPAPSMASMNE